MSRKLLSQRHPLLYFIAVWLKRTKRFAAWHSGKINFAKQYSTDLLPYRIKKHQSVLIRKLGVSDMQLQYNKITNLKIAAEKISGILVKPGETFSFCRRVGYPSKARGYLLGMELSFGKVRAGIGGGLCQIANLLHWLVMHSPLTVSERHHHSFDPFPDEGRVLPFSSGATVFYNYLDYQVKNKTTLTFQFNLWFTDKCLEGEIRTDQELDYVYHVYEKNHSIMKINDGFYRKNEIWRKKTGKYDSGMIREDEMLIRNFSKVLYTPESFEMVAFDDLSAEEKIKVLGY
jgi:vancomycin resistance protein VanW